MKYLPKVSRDFNTSPRDIREASHLSSYSGLERLVINDAYLARKAPPDSGDYCG